MNNVIPISSNNEHGIYFHRITGTHSKEKAIVYFCLGLFFLMIAKPAYEFIWYLIYGIGLILSWAFVLAYQSDYVLGISANLGGITVAVYCIVLAITMFSNGVRCHFKAKLETADILYECRCLVLVSAGTCYVVTQIYSMTKNGDVYKLQCEVCKLTDGKYGKPRKINLAVDTKSYQNSNTLASVLADIATMIS